MPRVIMLLPVTTGASLTTISLGIMHAMTRQGVRCAFFKPIAQPNAHSDNSDLTTTILHTYSASQAPESFSLSDAQHMISQHKSDDLLEQIVARFSQCKQEAKVVLIEGLVPTRAYPYANQLNDAIAKALDAEIVLVLAPGKEDMARLKARVEVASADFGGDNNPHVIGLIINRLDVPVEDHQQQHIDQIGLFNPAPIREQADDTVTQLCAHSPLPILGYLCWDLDLVACRASDMARHLKATIINAGQIETRRLKSITFCAHSIPHMIDYFQPGALLVTSADRIDVILAVCLACLNGITIGALLLTGGYPIDARLNPLCLHAFEAGLPVFLVESNTWQTALDLQRLSLDLPIDDYQRIQKVQAYCAERIDATWIASLTTSAEKPQPLSPATFRYQLTELARQANKRIVLPEGDEPRTIKAAARCAERGIAHCILLGDPTLIHQAAQAQGITLNHTIEIINPQHLYAHYIPRLMALRKHKGVTESAAQKWIKDNVVLGTLMLEQGAVDGLVSGAVHTTANTIRPALQLIKTAPDSSLVSSIFFMLLPEQVLVYGDCAINPDPTAEQLAEIAIQSADSAAAFNIEPRVAMISYSTGNSGSGSDVDKVRTAVKIAQQKRPDLILDGPLQYDAAIMADVAKSKAPYSPVAGRATVFIFPDLNTGNTTYKAVQRSANLISIGPMLQGLRRPVNDLSRGALVDDIVYTIALTAIQAAQASFI